MQLKDAELSALHNGTTGVCYPRIICAEITDNFGHAVPKDLLSLGIVSRIFLEPALDAMWKRLTSIEPLLSVLPETTLVNRRKLFLEPVAPSSWDRLRFYTSRVREFIAPFQYEELNVHDSVYECLGQKKPIFPKLRTLHLSLRLCDSNTFMFFLTTSLRVVSWPHPSLGSLPDSSSDLGPSLALLVSKSPELKSLGLNKYHYSGLSLTLRHLVDLEYFSAMDLSHLEVDFVQVIALLPKLTHLDLALPEEAFLDYTGVESGFPSLTKIELCGSTSDTRKFLAVIRPQALQELVIELSFKPSTEQSITAITYLLPSFPFLRSLVIVGDALSKLPVDLDDLQLWLLFEPLLELKRLEYLGYNIDLPVSDQKTARIASAWPHLKDLHLYLARGSSSLECLAHFARHCPNLESLNYSIQLWVPATPTPVIQDHPTLSMHPLRSFWCNVETDMMTADTMAHGLHQMFPNLEVVDGRGDGWTQVQKILWSLQNRRFEE
ncbi:hypothetical protein BDP27DRAFT_1521161 [Rhodocollybia butyracea]|uniref:Uncharacterized protein n=1 Tax=Rhodocollybia butyracea TaxID=206335 RepID=A0A9P5U7T4_9AGAR|nr:hypothetical protein BDP27DRAFT_1521161 [Rhodocollybia butyracea]